MESRAALPTITWTVISSRRRAYWLKTLHQWHWISSAICLLGMLLFAVTGLTLNNASHIESKAVVTTRHATLPQDALRQLAPGRKRRRCPTPCRAGWTANWTRPPPASRPNGPPMKSTCRRRAGGDAWLSIDLASGDIEYERTDRGWISYLNDCTRAAIPAWPGAGSWTFAVACLVFSLTGLVLLKLHAGNRAATWPMVGLGIVIPVVLALLFIH